MRSNTLGAGESELQQSNDLTKAGVSREGHEASDDYERRSRMSFRTRREVILVGRYGFKTQTQTQLSNLKHIPMDSHPQKAFLEIEFAITSSSQEKSTLF